MYMWWPCRNEEYNAAWCRYGAGESAGDSFGEPQCPDEKRKSCELSIHFAGKTLRIKNKKPAPAAKEEKMKTGGWPCTYGGKRGSFCESFEDSFGMGASGEPGCSIDNERQCRESIAEAEEEDGREK